MFNKTVNGTFESIRVENNTERSVHVGGEGKRREPIGNTPNTPQNIRLCWPLVHHPIAGAGASTPLNQGFQTPKPSTLPTLPAVSGLFLRSGPTAELLRNRILNLMGWWVGTRSLLGVGVDFTLRSAKSAEGWTRNHLVWGKPKYRNPT